MGGQGLSGLVFFGFVFSWLILVVWDFFGGFFCLFGAF